MSLIRRSSPKVSVAVMHSCAKGERNSFTLIRGDLMNVKVNWLINMVEIAHIGCLIALTLVDHMALCINVIQLGNTLATPCK